MKFNVVRFPPSPECVEKSQKVSILDGLVRMLVYTVGCRPVHYGFLGGENCRQTKNPNLPAPAEICSALTQSCSSRRNLSGPDKIVQPQKIFVLRKGSKIYLNNKDNQVKLSNNQYKLSKAHLTESKITQFQSNVS